jgi:hypothetical protein
MTLILVVVITVVAVVWWVWPRRVAVVAAEADARPGVLKRAASWVGRLRPPWPRRAVLTTAMGEWLHDADLARRLPLYKRLPQDAADLTAWLATLSAGERDQLVRRLSDQCRALGLELAWLTDARIPREWRRSLEDTVVLCALAAWNARRAQPLAAYIAWQRAPQRRANRAFAATLYARLVEAGLVTPQPTWLLAPEKERRQLIARAIRDAAAADPAAFLAALQAAAGTPADAGATASGDGPAAG